MSDAARGVRISIVIVTYNRAEELLRLIDSLESDLHRSDVELILVDDGSTDNTFELLQPKLAPIGDRACVLHQENSGPGTGRNRGIAAARGEIVVFIDTDCVVHPGWLDTLTAPFDDADVGAVGGPDRSRTDDPPLTRFIDYLMTSFLTTGGVRGATKSRGGSYHPRSFNMAARRDVARDIGGFPVIWYGEDILFSWRIAQSKRRLVFAPDAWVYHLRRTKLRAWTRQLYRMGRARWWMGRAYRELLEPVYAVPLGEWLIGIGALWAAASSGVIGTLGRTVLGVAAAYLMAIGMHSAFKLRMIASIVAVPFLFLVRETAYAAGSIAGIFSRVPDLRGGLNSITDTPSDH